MSEADAPHDTHAVPVADRGGAVSQQVQVADLERRAAVHHALSDPRRLMIVDALRLSDRTPTELRELTELGSNLLAFHLGVLEDVGVLQRTPSEGDARRRYVRLRPELLHGLWPEPVIDASEVLFVCTHNAARSQLAAALWHRCTGRPAASAGTSPAEQVHPLAVATARRHGLEVDATPRSYEEVDDVPDLVVSVCDRARETGPQFTAPALHWSVPDPIGGGPVEFERAYAQLAARVQSLADSTHGAPRGRR